MALAIAGCTESNPHFEDPGNTSPCDLGQVVIEPFNLASPDRVDILLVVDNSAGMGEAQDALSQAIPRFVQQLDSVQWLDYQLGVISTDIIRGDQQGRLQTGLPDQEGCPGDRPRIVTRNTSGGPTVARCNVLLGEDGDNFEAGLEAVRYALAGPAAQAGGENEGFLREDSRLVVIVFSNEDDCSDSGDLTRVEPNECEWERDALIPLTTYVGEDDSFYNVIRGANAGAPVDFVAIVGPDDGIVYQRPEPPRPVCSSNGNAFNGRRYLSVVEGLGDRGSAFNICNQRYESTLTDIIERHILPRDEVICPLLNLTQAPLTLRLVTPEDPNALVPLPEDSTGYLYLGHTDDCPTGAILISPARHGVLGLQERLEVHYCTDDPV